MEADASSHLHHFLVEPMGPASGSEMIYNSQSQQKNSQFLPKVSFIYIEQPLTALVQAAVMDANREVVFESDINHGCGTVKHVQDLAPQLCDGNPTKSDLPRPEKPLVRLRRTNGAR